MVSVAFKPTSSPLPVEAWTWTTVVDIAHRPPILRRHPRHADLRMLALVLMDRRFATAPMWRRGRVAPRIAARMAEPRPGVWVSQPLFDDIVGRGEYFDVDATAEVTAWTPVQVAEKLRGVAGAVVTLNERIGPAEIAQAHGLRAVANVGVGYDNLDVEALHARGIVATNTPDVLTETTADLGFALLLAAARRITEGERWLREGRWRQWSFDTLLGHDVHGATLGILGMGRIGQAIARRGALASACVLYNRSRLPAGISNCRTAYVDFDTLLRESDHLVLVCRMPQTRHVIDAAALAR